MLCLLQQEEATGDITFYMKGADVAMATIVQYNDWLDEEVSDAWVLDPKKVVYLKSEPNMILSEWLI